MAILFGLMYLVLLTFPRLWVERYHAYISMSGLHFISAGVGLVLGAQVCALFQDRICRRVQRGNGGVSESEYRIPFMFLGSFFVPLGISVYA